MVGIAIAVGAAVVGYSAYSAEKAEDKQVEAQRESQAAQSRLASADAARARLEQARESRIRAAQIAASGINAGVGTGSSGVLGGVGSVRSQTAANIGTISQRESFAEEISYYNQKAAEASLDVANAKQWGQLGMQVASWGVGKIK